MRSACDEPRAARLRARKSSSIQAIAAKRQESASASTSSRPFAASRSSSARTPGGVSAARSRIERSSPRGSRAVAAACPRAGPRIDVGAVRASHLHPGPSPSTREEASKEGQAHLVLLLDVVIRFAKEDDAFRRDRVHPCAGLRTALEIDGQLLALRPVDERGLRRSWGRHRRRRGGRARASVVAARRSSLSSNLAYPRRRNGRDAWVGEKI